MALIISVTTRADLSIAKDKPNALKNLGKAMVCQNIDFTQGSINPQLSFMPIVMNVGAIFRKFPK